MRRRQLDRDLRSAVTIWGTNRSTSSWLPIWLSCLCLAFPVAAGSASAPPPADDRDTSWPSASTISTVPLPGGVEGIRRALGDREATRPELLGVEIARRFYGGSDESGRDGTVFSQLTADRRPTRPARVSTPRSRRNARRFPVRRSSGATSSSARRCRSRPCCPGFSRTAERPCCTRRCS
jgi:hypothetical protein